MGSPTIPSISSIPSTILSTIPSTVPNQSISQHLTNLPLFPNLDVINQHGLLGMGLLDGETSRRTCSCLVSTTKCPGDYLGKYGHFLSRWEPHNMGQTDLSLDHVWVSCEVARNVWAAATEIWDYLGSNVDLRNSRNLDRVCLV